MKVYEKPKLVMMSISGNDLLCSCDVDSEGSNADPAYLATIATIENLGFIAFDLPEKCTWQVEQYCKFLSTTNIITNS